MRDEHLLHRETLLIELLISSLDTRGTAQAIGSTMLNYLSDLLVEQTHKELEEIRALMIEAGGEPVNTRDAQM